MKRIFVIFLLPAVCCLPSLFIGCGGERLPDGMPRLYPATVTVMQDGKPLPEARVTMMNTDPAVNWPTGGTTDNNGVIRLMTMGRYSGAPAGTYRVYVSKIEMPEIPDILRSDPPTGPEGSPAPATRQEYNRLVQNINENSFYVVDPKFALTPGNEGTSGLSVEITPSNFRVTVDVSPAVRIQTPAQFRGI